MTFKVGKLRINLMMTHRWEKDLDYWQKEKWNDFRFGPRIRYWDNPNISVLFGFYLIVAKVWITFSKSLK
jgi:hypothetical protein